MRKVYILPNLFTTGNIFCGVYSLSLVLKSVPQYSRAAWFIMLAMLFDFLDGQVARRYRATSDFGVEYDSLADFFLLRDSYHYYCLSAYSGTSEGIWRGCGIPLYSILRSSAGPL